MSDDKTTIGGTADDETSVSDGPTAAERTDDDLAQDCGRTINVAVIGAGSGVAPNHFQAFNLVENTEVVAAVEIDDTRRERVAEDYGVTTYPTMQDLADSRVHVDLVVICVPDALHARFVAEAVSHGWHVLCEKPLATNRREARRMFRLAAEAGVHLSVALQRRYMTPRIEQVVDEGKIGVVRQVRITWNRYQGMPESRKGLEGRGGVVADLASHLYSQAVRLFGNRRPLRISAWVSSVISGARVEDEAFVVADMEDDGLLRIDCAFDLTLEGGRDEVTLEVIGDRGRIIAPLLTTEDENEADWCAPRLLVRSEVGVKSIRLRPLLTVLQCHVALAEDVVSKVRLGKSASPEEIEREVEQMTFLDAVYEAAQGRVIGLLP